MAELNLVPNPTLLVVQTGVFLTNVWLVNTLILKPYQKLKDARDQATVGNQDEAHKILKNITSMSAAIKQKTTEALEQARQSIKSARDQAHVQQHQIVSAATDEAHRTLEGFREELGRNLKAERERSKEVFGALSDEIYKKLLN